MTDDVGSLSEEAVKLAAALQAWARGEGTGRMSAALGHMATGEPACCVCPLCLAISVLRGQRPELTAALLESLTGLVGAGQALMETVTAAAAARPAPTGPPEGPVPPPASHDRPPSRVQNIPLD